MRTGMRVLAEGNLLGIYPEGTRSPDGRLYRGKTGVARLALEAQVPVIPCAMINTFEFMPPGRTRPSFRVRPGVRYGEPLDFSRYYGMPSDRRALREVTDEIMRVIEKLSGQQSVEMYAQTAKEKLAAGQPLPELAQDKTARNELAPDELAPDELAEDEPPADGEL
jgi:1-acyl-sn-glycerol-3-phosphate acyltransferase